MFWGNLRSLGGLLIPASSFLWGHESAQQKVPTTIACTQLTKAPALFNYHKNAVCNRGEGSGGLRGGVGGALGIHGHRRMKPGSFYLLNYMQAAFSAPPSDTFGHFFCREQ